MSQIRKVALAGATGNLGPTILNRLLAHNFAVTVLTRHTNTHIFPPSVPVKHVDYNSLPSLVSALQGQDAVISTLGTLSLSTSQSNLITAAAQAGVKRFIPSEFGSDSTNPKATLLPTFAQKIEAQKLLKEMVEKTGMSYTLIFTGPFLDWGVRRGVMRVKEKRITMFDSGERVFSTTTLETIGRAVCAVLERSEETENKVLRIQDTSLTLKRLFEIGKKAVGEDGWCVEEVKVEDMLESAWEGYRDGKRDLGTMLGFIQTAVWGDGYGGHFEEIDNELLGLREMTDEEVQGVVDKVARE